jgi:hypothetical protein
MLVSVLRGRTAVTLGHGTSWLGLGGSVRPRLVASPHEHQPGMLFWDVAGVKFAIPSRVEYPT